MGNFLKLVSYIFHPLFMPLFGSLLYYAITPKYSPLEIKGSVLIKIIILTICIPIILYYLLKNLGLVSSIFLEKVSDRKIPLYAQLVLIFLVLRVVMPQTYAPELYFFFVGILATSVGCLLLVFFKIKASIHMMGIASITMFVVVLSIHYKINLLILIGLLVIFSGLVATSRLSLKAHTVTELTLGSLLGLVPQFMVINYWM